MEAHPWFNPPYRRVLVLVFCALWALLEAYDNHASIWFWGTAGLSVFLVYDFFFSGKYPVDDPDQT